MNINPLLFTIQLEFPINNFSGKKTWGEITEIFRDAIYDSEIVTSSKKLEFLLLKTLFIGRDGPQTSDAPTIKKYVELLNVFKKDILNHSNLICKNSGALEPEFKSQEDTVINNPLEKQEISTKDAVINSPSKLKSYQEFVNKIEEVWTEFQSIEQDIISLEEILEEARVPNPSEKLLGLLNDITLFINKMKSECKSIEEVIKQLEVGLGLHQTLQGLDSSIDVDTVEKPQNLDPSMDIGTVQTLSQKLDSSIDIDTVQKLKTNMLNFLIETKNSLNEMQVDLVGLKVGDELKKLTEELQKDVSTLEEIAREARETNDPSILKEQQVTLIELHNKEQEQLKSAQKAVDSLEEILAPLLQNILVLPVYRIHCAYHIFNLILRNSDPLSGLKLDQKTLTFNLVSGQISEESWLKNQREITSEWIKEQEKILNELKNSIYRRYQDSTDEDKKSILDETLARLKGNAARFSIVEMADPSASITQEAAAEEILSSIFFPKKRIAEEPYSPVPPAKRTLTFLMN